MPCFPIRGAKTNYYCSYCTASYPLHSKILIIIISGAINHYNQ